MLRFGEHVERVMPLIMKFARQEDDELKEHVLQVAQQRFFLIIVKWKKLQDADPSSTRKFNTGTGTYLAT